MDDAGTDDIGSSDKQLVIVILDQASLEIVNTKSGDFTLLNCDDHISLMWIYLSLLTFSLILSFALGRSITKILQLIVLILFTKN